MMMPSAKRGDLMLTGEERAMLAGEQGSAARKAMEIIVALARIFGAERLVPVAHAQVAGVSYKNLGDAGLDFVREWAEEGARVRVPTTMNPAGMDMERWRTLGIPEEFAAKQRQVVGAYAAMGIEETLSCTPYLIGHRPALGDHLAWSESSAVSFSNSVLGARTNREGGPSALAAAITGRTPMSGYHLDEGRLATHEVRVTCPVERQVDFGALGYLVGRRVNQGVPYFRFEAAHESLSPDSTVREDRLKTLGAAMAASGAVALYHVERITPEARRRDMLLAGAEVMSIDSLEEGVRALDGSLDEVDFVSVGCPHASLVEIAEIAEAVSGKAIRAKLWVTTAAHTRAEAVRRGWVAKIEEAGGIVAADTCVVVAPIELLGYKSVATNSAKAATYLPSHGGVGVRYGSLERCVQAALTGRWRG
jgi:predicted aconitase